MPDLTYVLEAPGELMTLPAQVSDPARRRRIRHRQANVLTVAIRATVAGMRGVAAVAEWAAQVPHEGRARRGDRGLPRQPRYVTPSEPALRRPLQKLDVDGVDQELGRFRAPRAPGPGGRRGWHDGAGGPQPRRHAGPLLGSGVHQGG
ncbi:MAG TPA: transposase family protein [Verrucomicrobiae bacterium]|nr:transposase family protein [Verrucomicrobiae bacterium]